MLNKFKISKKLSFLGILQLAIMVCLSGVALSQMKKIGIELVDIAEVDIPITKSLTLITEHELHQAILFEKTLLKWHLQKGNLVTKEEFQKYAKETVEYGTKIETEINDTIIFINKKLELVHAEDARIKLTNLQNALRELKPLHHTFLAKIKEIFDKLDNGEFDQTGVNEAEALSDKIEHNVVTLLNDIQDFTEKAALKAEHDEILGMKMLIAITVIGFIISAVFSKLITRNITAPLSELRALAMDLASGEGDLRKELSSKAHDETGDISREVNSFIQKLRQILSGVVTSADNLGKSSENSIEVIQSTNRCIAEQGEQTQKIAQSVANLQSSTLAVANNTAHASKITLMVKNRVNEGGQAATNAQSAITKMAEEMDNTSRVIKELALHSEKISSFVDVINNIAEQTNLLALNAAIEAARAGESGRGFAVVADEVRGLAQNSQGATNDIKELVDKLETAAKNAVQTIEESAATTTHCLDQSSKSADALNDANSAVSEIDELNEEIASTMQKQADLATEMNDNVAKIKSMMVSTQDNVKKTNQANKDIAENLVTLHSNLNQFIF